MGILYKLPIMRLLSLFMFIQLSGCDGHNNTSKKEENRQEVEINVGSRTIKTDRFTETNTPVVSMWDAGMPYSDKPDGIGYKELTSAEHAVVWQPDTMEQGGYNHYACLIQYKGRFYAMWGNHKLGEDAPGQRVLFNTSMNWNQWSGFTELFSPPGPIKPRSEDGIHLKPDRWAIVDDVLYAIVYVHGAGRYPIACEVDKNGMVGTPFLLDDLPTNAQLPQFMSGLPEEQLINPVSNSLKDWYRKNHQISWWASSDQGVTRKGVDNAELIESFMYSTKDGQEVIMMRNWGTSSNPVHNNRIYVSFRTGESEWGVLHPTDIPDSPSRAQAITLDDGSVLLIGNQIVPYLDKALYLDRDPMTISVSSDGYRFDRAYVLRKDTPNFRFEGIGGRNKGFAYSSSIVLDGYLYTLYSINKEEMGITRVALEAMDL